VIGLVRHAARQPLRHRAGLNLDVVVPFIEHLFGVQFLAKDVYYVSELPSDLHYGEVMLVAGLSFLISLLATIYPKLPRVQDATGGGATL